jgi:hypothetical protein
MKHYVIESESPLYMLKPTYDQNIVRLGRASDGGYVCSKKSVLYSDLLVCAGLGNEFSFERDFRRMNPESRIQMYDHTVSFSLQKLLTSIIKFNFYAARVYLGFQVRKTFFFNRLSRNDLYGLEVRAKSIAKESVSLEDMLTRTKSENIFLKIDIEGGEYELLETILKYSRVVTSLVIEFHRLNDFQRELLAFSSELLRTHKLINVNANNYDSSGVDFPNIIELTFLRLDLFEPSEIAQSMYNFPNNNEQPEIRIVFKD